MARAAGCHKKYLHLLSAPCRLAAQALALTPRPHIALAANCNKAMHAQHRSRAASAVVRAVGTSCPAAHSATRSSSFVSRACPSSFSSRAFSRAALQGGTVVGGCHAPLEREQR